MEYYKQYNILGYVI